ncbi:MAG: nucleotide exchange factor GrpE [Pseudomonadota bacterium]
MTDQNKHQEKPAETPETDDVENLVEMSEEELLAALAEQASESDVSDEMEPEGEGFANPLEALAAENTRQEEEIAGLKDQMLRTAAEMENLRRRTQKDVADARSFSISGFARDILGVADNLRRAIDHVDEANKDQPGLKSLIEGVEMTERELANALEKNGVKPISPENEKFDPNFHQAMFEIPNTEVPNNTVLQVVQVGYKIGERVLRPAMVGVSRGGPKTAPSEATDPSEE